MMADGRIRMVWCGVCEAMGWYGVGMRDFLLSHLPFCMISLARWVTFIFALHNRVLSPFSLQLFPWMERFYFPISHSLQRKHGVGGGNSYACMACLSYRQTYLRLRYYYRLQSLHQIRESNSEFHIIQKHSRILLMMNSS
jgi:hypothetical protein